MNIQQDHVLKLLSVSKKKASTRVLAYLIWIILTNSVSLAQNSQKCYRWSLPALGRDYSYPLACALPLVNLRFATVSNRSNPRDSLLYFGCRRRIRTSTERLDRLALSQNLHPRERRARLPVSSPYSVLFKKFRFRNYSVWMCYKHIANSHIIKISTTKTVKVYR